MEEKETLAGIVGVVVGEEDGEEEEEECLIIC